MTKRLLDLKGMGTLMTLIEKGTPCARDRATSIVASLSYGGATQQQAMLKAGTVEVCKTQCVCLIMRK